MTDRRRRFAYALLGLLVVGGLVVLGLFMVDYFTVDACLDRGGRWDKNQHVCIGVNVPVDK